MLALFSLPPIYQLVRVGLLLLALIVVWGLLRIILRLTMKIFTCGCTLIVAVGVILALVLTLGNS